MLARTCGALIVLGFLTACQSNELTSTSTAKPPTIIVTNATCEAGHCMTLEVRAFIPLFPFPQLPIGATVLAYARPGQTCFRLPDSLVGTISGGSDTTRFLWTPNYSMSLAAIDSALQYGHPPTPAGLDSAQHAIYPYDGLFTSTGEGVSFTPTDAPGWATTFPMLPQHSVPIVPAAPCVPK
jgi:hypothetical protein